MIRGGREEFELYVASHGHQWGQQRRPRGGEASAGEVCDEAAAFSSCG